MDVREPMDGLEALGWGPFFARQLGAAGEEGLLPARVCEDLGVAWRVLVGPGDERPARAPGRLRRDGATRGTLPVVGDWVLLRPDRHGKGNTVQRVLERRTRLTRRSAGERPVEQVLAANLDVAFLTQSLNRDLSPRRLERYLVLAREGGVEPVVVLTKADLCEAPEPLVASVVAAAGGAPVLVTSARRPDGLEPLRAWLAPGRTAVLLGSSGVGKSTLLNGLLGEERQRTREVREADARGRHTTTTRALVVLPGGALVVDTPGMRELGLPDVDDGVAKVFDDIAAFAAGCRFGDCGHDSEPGCAVAAAVAEGRLPPGRLESWRKLQREASHAAIEQDLARKSEQNRRWRALHKELRRFQERRGR